MIDRKNENKNKLKKRVVENKAAANILFTETTIDGVVEGLKFEDAKEDQISNFGAFFENSKVQIFTPRPVHDFDLIERNNSFNASILDPDKIEIELEPIPSRIKSGDVSVPLSIPNDNERPSL